MGATGPDEKASAHVAHQKACRPGPAPDAKAAQQRELSQSPAAVRARRKREREKDGLAIYKLPLPAAWVADMLISSGFLDPLAADDHDRTAEALLRMILAARPVTRDDTPGIFPAR